MLLIRFLKDITVHMIETIISDDIQINEYDKNIDSHFYISVSQIIPTNKTSEVDLMIEEENRVKIYKNVDLSYISILKGDIPQFLQSKSVPSQPPPCGSCGKK